MKKLIVCVLTLAMLVSMFSVVGAAGEETVLADLSVDSGLMSALSFNDETNDDMYLRATITTLEADHEGWGFGAFCDSTWSVNVISIKAGSVGTNVTEWSFSEILAAYSNAGVDATAGMVLNIWDPYATLDKLEIVYRPSGEQVVIDSIEDANGLSGHIAFLSGYTFTEENILLKLTIETTEADKDGWGLGALCENTEGWPQAISIPASTVGTSTKSWTLKELGEAFAAKGLDPTKGVAINAWATYASVIKVELIEEVFEEDEEVELEPNVIYKQMAENENGSYNARFVQLISTEDASSYSSVNFAVKYNGAIKANASHINCYTEVSAAGDTLTAPEGYVFVACVIKNIPAAFSFDLLTCDMDFTPVAAQ